MRPVATESKKSLLDRIRDKVSDNLIDWLLEGLKWLIGSALLGAWAILARHWLAKEWGCITAPWCAVRGWSLGMLIAFTLMMSVAAIAFGRLWYRTQRELRALAKPNTPQFRDIEVEDKKLNLRWRIRRPPHEWRHWRNIASTRGWVGVHQVLDGPFHAAPGCMAPLVEIPATLMSSHGSPTFAENCRQCGQRIFVGLHAEEGRRVAVWPVRAYALEELQRMEMNGTKIPEARWCPPIVLENPEYWKLMLPPPCRDG